MSEYETRVPSERFIKEQHMKTLEEREAECVEVFGMLIEMVRVFSVLEKLGITIRLDASGPVDIGATIGPAREYLEKKGLLPRDGT